MRYSLYDDLLDDNNILSHVFLECLSAEQSKRIADKSLLMSEKEIKKRKIEVELIIDGESVNPKAFFDLFEKQYEEIVKKEATRLVKEQVSEKFSDIADKIRAYEEITEEWADEINWKGDISLTKTKASDKTLFLCLKWPSELRVTGIYPYQSQRLLDPILEMDRNEYEKIDRITKMIQKLQDEHLWDNKIILEMTTGEEKVYYIQFYDFTVKIGLSIRERKGGEKVETDIKIF